jgi:hypothetical protein
MERVPRKSESGSRPDTAPARPFGEISRDWNVGYHHFVRVAANAVGRLSLEICGVEAQKMDGKDGRM